MNLPVKSPFVGLIFLLAPGVALSAFALLSDVVRGGGFRADWGTGQSAMLTLGVCMLLMGMLIHRKALADQRQGGRRYGRTLTFILVPLLALVAVPLFVAEAVARLLPKPDDTNSSYRQTDPEFGFSIAPNRQYHVISRPKNFDIRVRIDRNGFRRGPGEEQVDLASADVVIVGDSHPFGFGVAEDQTLSVHLASLLRQADRPGKVLNAGVPGFGLGQSLLRVKSFHSRLRPGAVVVLFINPINDLVNLASAVDYHYPKPHATIASGRLVFQKAPSDWGEGAFLFSQPFDSLNQFFGLADRRRWYHSALYRRLSHSAVEPATVDGWTVLSDSTSPQQYLIDDANRIRNEPLLYASRFWPEMPRFEKERQYLASLSDAVLAEMVRTARESNWHLIAVVANEAYQHQRYSQGFLEQVQAVSRDTPIELGWSRQTVLASLRDSSIDLVSPDYSGLDPEPLFVQNDDHTSGQGHRLIAELVASRIVEETYLDEKPVDGAAHEEPDFP